jgi:hypothetical protein
MKLKPGEETAVIPINSRERWNDTQIDVDPGERYQFTASGKWVDFYIPASPDGFSTPLSSILPFERYLRHPDSKFFALIGCLDRRPEQQFVIGRGASFEPSVHGRLFCFANDVPGFYWNNWGRVDLTVKRLE